MHPEDLKWVRIPLDVRSVKTEKSIEIIIAGVIGGVAGGLASKFGEDIYIGLKRLMRLAYKRLKEKAPEAERPNLTGRRIDLIEYRMRTLIERERTGEVTRKEIVHESMEVVDSMQF